MNNADIIKKINIDYSLNINKIEENVYKILSEKKIDRNHIIFNNIVDIVQDTINEFIKTDLEIRKCENTWVCKNLDGFYNIRLNQINLDEDETFKILPRTKSHEMRIKIINVNIVIACLSRIEGVFLYTKLKKGEYPKDIEENVQFTKGYIVCFEPRLVENLKECEYVRKRINTKPVIIRYISNKYRVLDVIDNKNFSKPIWIRNNNIIHIYSKLKIWNNILEKNFDANILIRNINYLNRVEIGLDWVLISKIKNVAERSNILDNNIISKNCLKNNVYQINKESEETIITDDTEVSDIKNKFVNNAATYELIIKQLEQIKDKTFYLNHLYDSRTRIYCENWPINYQLNHIVRNTIIIRKKHTITDIYERFLNDVSIKEYIKNYKVFISDYVQEDEQIKKFIKEKCKWGVSENNLEYRVKKEILFIYLKKLAEKRENNTIKAIKIGIEIAEEFIYDKKEENIEYWIDRTKIKKVPLLINIKKIIKDITQDVFDGTFWGDASSNAIQLITLRLGNLNEKLLMLTNIIENKTEYNNIYNYVTEEIRIRDHKEFLDKIKNKIKDYELISLQNDEENKYRIMPASYGMGAHKNLKDMEKKMENRKEIWEKLNSREKSLVARYIWDTTFKILREIGFDLNEYKGNFKVFKEFDLCAWFSDYGLPVIPINIRKSNRQNILKKINELKMKINTEEDQKEIIKNKIEKLKIKRDKDDKEFWIRSMVSIDSKVKNSIYVRIPSKKIKIDEIETKRALIPNSIHSYDSSIMALSIEICERFEIPMLPIHDSIGTNIIYAPIVKIIFKIANIMILEKSMREKPFPFNNKSVIKREVNKEEIDKLKKLIIESTNFFK